MSNLQKSKLGCIVLIILMVVAVLLQYTVWSEYADTLNWVVSTLAGMAVVSAIHSFEEGNSIGKGIIVVALVLFIFAGLIYMFASNLAVSFLITAGGIVMQCVYAWGQKQ
ncbi:MAG: hypothetical protein E7203_09725 [Selenomonas ruminantium]|uniref:Uncharacterized protein n=1 Tax=Selenomonas ruminantium TaxID=971 RepID=A0A927ZR03_SELRU|nr:hypothetical protein [Selenomonas ruminantium]MBE6085709.1 hypothetical protein [Selenomonas ruminantium]